MDKQMPSAEPQNRGGIEGVDLSSGQHVSPGYRVASGGMRMVIPGIFSSSGFEQMHKGIHQEFFSADTPPNAAGLFFCAGDLGCDEY